MTAWGWVYLEDGDAKRTLTVLPGALGELVPPPSLTLADEAAGTSVELRFQGRFEMVEQAGT